MTLLLTLVRGPAGVTLERREFVAAALRLGRGPENDWVLADADRVISKRHCVLAFRSGVWSVVDVSTNGTYLNGETRPIGPAAPRTVRSGDRLRLGGYEIELTIAAEPPDAGEPGPVPFAEPADLDRTRFNRPPPIDATARVASGDDLMAAFLRGARIAGPGPEDAAHAMETIGAAFRAMVSGIRQTLLARAAVKGELRIEQTMVQARGNNPLKFSVDDDDALVALLGMRQRRDMAAPQAVADALRDIRLHELASLTAMQEAVRSLLARFDPAGLGQTAEQGGFNLLPAQKKARGWDAFAAMHAQVTRGLTDDFDGVFGRAFAEAYERAMREAGDDADAAP